MTGDSGCPDDTDQIFQTTGGLTAGDPLACGRNLAPPHPGDPGGGGGPKIIVGDCVWVSPAGGGVLSTNVYEVPCAEKEGYFAQAVGRTTSKAGCPAATTISRFALTDGAVLCLGQGSAGQIATVGNCVISRTDPAIPETLTACGPDSLRLVAFAATYEACPAGSSGLATLRLRPRPLPPPPLTTHHPTPPTGQ